MIQSPSQCYAISQAAVFRHTNDEFGGLSNMSKAFPLTVYGVRVRSSEHLYQMMRFSHRPNIQRAILAAAKPMAAKQVSRQHDTFTRVDWLEVRVEIMRWAIAMKLAQHLDTFGSLLDATRDRPIVEYSRRDTFWGAEPDGPELLVGCNVLGRILMESRERFRHLDPSQLSMVDAAEHLGLHFLGLPLARLDHRRMPELPSLIDARDIYGLNLTSGQTAGMLTAYCRQQQLAGRIQSCQQAEELALKFAVQIEQHESYTENEHVRQ